MTFPIDEHEDRDRSEKYRDEYPDEREKAENHTYADEHADHDPHQKREDEEDHIQAEPHDKRPAHVATDEDNHPRYARDETHDVDIGNDRYRHEENGREEEGRSQESAERGEDKPVEADGVRSDEGALRGQEGEGGAERKREGDGSQDGNADGEKQEEENEEDSGVSLFVRNVARHVVEDQLVTLFSKVSFSVVLTRLRVLQVWFTCA